MDNPVQIVSLLIRRKSLTELHLLTNIEKRWDTTA